MMQPADNVPGHETATACSSRIKAVTGRRFMIRLVFKLLLPLAALKFQFPALTSDYPFHVCSLVIAGFIYCPLIEFQENTDLKQESNQKYLEIVLHTCLIILATSLVTVLLPPDKALLVFISLVSFFIPLLVAVWFKTEIVDILKAILVKDHCRQFNTSA